VSVFGTNLAASKQLASTLPLPLTMGGVSATVNGVAAPLLYVSPSQLNIQIPLRDHDRYGTAGRQQQRARGYQFVLCVAIGSGLFIAEPAGHRARSPPPPAGGRGQQFALYVTGAGEVSSPIATGRCLPDQVPVPLLPVSCGRRRGGGPELCQAASPKLSQKDRKTHISREINILIGCSRANAPLRAHNRVRCHGRVTCSPARVAVTRFTVQ